MPLAGCVGLALPQLVDAIAEDAVTSSKRGAIETERCLRRLVKAQSKLIDALYAGRDPSTSERAVDAAATALSDVEDLFGPGGWYRPCVSRLPKKEAP